MNIVTLNDKANTRQEPFMFSSLHNSSSPVLFHVRDLVTISSLRESLFSPPESQVWPWLAILRLVNDLLDANYLAQRWCLPPLQHGYSSPSHTTPRMPRLPSPTLAQSTLCPLPLSLLLLPLSCPSLPVLRIPI